MSMAWGVVQATTSTPRAPLRWRRRSKATRRCRRSTSNVCGPLAACILREWGGHSRGPRECASGAARAAGVVVGAACMSAGSEHGVVRGAGNDIDAKGAVALAAALQGNTTLLTLNLGRMWTARCVYFAGMGRPLKGTS